MSFYHNKKKTFKPLVLYDSNHPSESTSMSDNDTYLDQHQLIEEHKVRTRNMLEYNAQMWENEGRTGITASDQPPSPRPNHSPLYSTNFQFERPSQSNRSSMSFSDDQKMTFGGVQQSKTSPTMLSTSKVNVLEPQTQNTIPLPLYSHELLIREPVEPSMAYDSASTQYNQELLYPTGRSEEEYEEEYDEEPFVQTTTFITEPQFHHTYKPQISSKRRRGNLPKEVTEFLKRWLILHKKHPYPTEREKQALADETGLMVNQISNWFINARRRILQPLLESESRQIHRAESSSAPTSSGVNVVGSSSNNSVSGSIYKNFGTNTMKSPTMDNNNYYPHHHHNYNNNSATDTNSLLLKQPTIEDERANTETEKGKQRTNIPPPWVLLPTKLPSMNILEKDLDAFEPKD